MKVQHVEQFGRFRHAFDALLVIAALIGREIARHDLQLRIAGPDAFGNERVRLSLEGAVDRLAFGVSWNTPLPSGDPALAQDVALTTELSFVKAQ